MKGVSEEGGAGVRPQWAELHAWEHAHPALPQPAGNLAPESGYLQAPDTPRQLCLMLPCMPNKVLRAE